MQEVSAQTSNYDAEFGRAGGAVVNTITKSGSDDFHGSLAYLFDVTRDDAITNTQSLSAAIRDRGIRRAVPSSITRAHWVVHFYFRTLAKASRCGVTMAGNELSFCRVAGTVSQCFKHKLPGLF